MAILKLGEGVCTLPTESTAVDSRNVLSVLAAVVLSDECGAVRCGAVRGDAVQCGAGRSGGGLGGAGQRGAEGLEQNIAKKHKILKTLVCVVASQ